MKKCPSCGRGCGFHYEGCSLDPFLQGIKRLGAVKIGDLPPNEETIVNLKIVRRRKDEDTKPLL